MKKVLLIIFFHFLFISFLVAQSIWIWKSYFSGGGRWHAVSFSINNKGYFGTGHDGSTVKNDFYEYDPDISVWTRKTDFGGTPRQSSIGFAMSNNGYLGLGIDIAGMYRKDFWEYNPVSNTWTRKADFPGTARAASVAFVIGNKAYVGTGYDGSYKKDFWEYNPSNNLWTKIADFPGTSRSGAIAFTIGNRGYVGTGHDGSYTKDFWEYDPSNNSWRRIVDFPGTGRYGASTFKIGQYAYVGLGRISFDAWVNDFWRFDSVNGNWMQALNFPDHGRQNSASFLLNEKGYILGGGLAGPSTGQIYEYVKKNLEWICSFNILDNYLRAKRSLYFGQSNVATNGIDWEFGEYPFVPTPSSYFDASFIIPTNVHSLVDIRPYSVQFDSSVSIQWLIAFQQGYGYPITFDWPSNLLPAGKFILEDTIDGSVINVNMKEQKKFILSDTDIKALRIKYSKNVLIIESGNPRIEFKLLQNYPNPFNPSTTIKFALPERAKVNLSIYNLLGEKITELVNGEMDAGYHETQWNASGFVSGIYFYKISTNSFTDVKKLILLK